MSLSTEIKAAIGAHGLWKARLAAAIESGKSDFTPEKICVDNQCDFGKWLYGASIAAADKTGPHYEAVRKMHAEFHRVTADILKLALSGRKAEAKNLMTPDSKYVALSSELTRGMMKWAEAAK